MTDPMTRMRLGTRGSPLALAQANAVANRLRRFGAEVEIVPIRTEGDRRLDARLAAIGGKGLFVKEIEEALLDGAIDAAVHSLKDLPAEVPAGLTLAAFPEREDPRDVLVTRTGARFEDLPPAAVIGTSSPRRRAIVLSLRPDLVVEPMRGNVDTRLKKLEGGGWDGVILAAAGLHPRHPRAGRAFGPPPDARLRAGRARLPRAARRLVQLTDGRTRVIPGRPPRDDGARRERGRATGASRRRQRRSGRCRAPGAA